MSSFTITRPAADTTTFTFDTGAGAAHFALTALKLGAASFTTDGKAITLHHDWPKAKGAFTGPRFRADGKLLSFGDTAADTAAALDRLALFTGDGHFAA